MTPFLLALCDLILRDFITAIIVLSTISHILITTNPHVLLVWHPVFLIFTVVWFICTCAIHRFNVLFCLIWSVSVNMSFRCSVLVTVCSLRYCSVVIGIFQMCLCCMLLACQSLSTSLCIIAHYSLCCTLQQSSHTSMVHHHPFIWLLWTL